MVKENETNYLYLSGLLKTDNRCSSFFNNLSQILEKNKIQYELLKNTKDIWAKNYMPVQVKRDKFIQFKYDPDYLKTQKGNKIKTDQDLLYKEIDIDPIKRDIIVDGGNVIKTTNKVIMTDKIFPENYTRRLSDIRKIPELFKKKLLNKLREIFEVDELIIIPRLPGDYLGHADGIVKFYNEETVLLNDYEEILLTRNYSRNYKNTVLEIKHILKAHHLEIIEIPHKQRFKTNEMGMITAIGDYINFLEMKDLVILPTFGLKEDDEANELFSKLYKNVETLYSFDIANYDGVLNCISCAYLIN